MFKYTIRAVTEGDQIGRQKVLDFATNELRRIYQPVSKKEIRETLPDGVLVSVNESLVIGTVEYILDKGFVSVQGVAIHPNYRKQGVCRLLVETVADLARQLNYPALSLSVIEETGNVRVFEKLGFRVVASSTDTNYIGPNGEKVRCVEMVRKL